MWPLSQLRIPEEVWQCVVEHLSGWEGTNRALADDEGTMRYDFLIEALEWWGVFPQFHSGDQEREDSYLTLTDSEKTAGQMCIWLPSGGFVTQYSERFPDWHPKWMIADSRFYISVLPATANRYAVAACVIDHTNRIRQEDGVMDTADQFDKAGAIVDLSEYVQLSDSPHMVRKARPVAQFKQTSSERPRSAQGQEQGRKCYHARALDDFPFATHEEVPCDATRKAATTVAQSSVWAG